MATHDGILLYNTADLDEVRVIFKYLTETKGLDIWFADAHLRPGEPLDTIGVKMQGSRFALVCLGPDGMGGFQGLEFSAVLAEAARPGRAGSFIPVVLPKTNLDVHPHRPWITGRKWLDLRQSVHDKVQLGSLAAVLLEGRAAAGVAAPAAATGAPPQGSASISSVFDELVRRVAKNGLTVFLGSTVPERHDDQVPSVEAIAGDLYRQPELASLAIAPGAPPAMKREFAAFFYGLLAGSDQASSFTRERHRRRSLGEPAAYTEVARLFSDLGRLVLKELAKKPVPLLCVTTNVDLSVERALVKHEVPFVRVVFHHGETRFSCVEVKKIVRREDHSVVLGGTNEFETVSVGALDPASRSVYERVYREINRQMEFAAFVEVAELNRVVAEIEDKEGVACGRAREDGSVTLDELDTRLSACAAAGRSRLPLILFKPYGSLDITDSCAFAVGQYYSLGRRMRALPNLISTAIQQNATLLVGLNLTEPHFVHLYETYLAESFTKTKSERVALIQHPTAPRDGQDAIDIAMLPALSSRAPDLFHIKVVDEDPATAFTRLRDRLKRAADEERSAWI